MLIKHYFSLIFLPFLSFSFLMGQSPNSTAVNQMLTTKGLEHASIGFCVKDLSGNIIAQHNMNQSYVPASTLKLITTATAFEVLGADFQYETLLARGKMKPNRLIVYGSGDPTLGSEHLYDKPDSFLSEWVKAVADAFGQQKEIEVLAVDNYFGYRGVSRKWIHEDIGNYFAAGAYGLSVFDNTYRLVFNTENRNSAPKIIETKPLMKDLVFNNTLTLNTTSKDNGYILGEPFSNQRNIIGDIPANRKRFTIKGDIPNPGLFLVGTISSELEQAGFKVGKKETTYNKFHDEMYLTNRAEVDGTVFYVHKSPNLSKIARIINLKSNNHYTEHLIRTLGRQRNKDIYSLPLEEGVEKIRDVWESKGLNTNALIMYDGCGLAPSNAVSAAFMCDVLKYMQTESANGVQFFNSLPLAGREGTVRNFLKGTRLEGKVHVKSGSIANVQCFAGYYVEGEKKYTFSIMVNNYYGSRQSVVKAIERLLLASLR